MKISNAQILRNAGKLLKEAKHLEKQLMKLDGTEADNDPRKECVAVSLLNEQHGQTWGSIEKKDIIDGNSMFMRAYRINKKGEKEVFTYKREVSDYDFYTNDVKYTQELKSGKNRCKDMQEIYDGFIVSIEYKEGASVDTPIDMPLNMP